MEVLQYTITMVDIVDLTESIGFVHPTTYYISGEISEDKQQWTPHAVQSTKSPTHWLRSQTNTLLV